MDTGLPKPQGTQKRRKLAGSQGHGAPPSTQRPGPQQLCGGSPHKPAITRPGLAQEPMSQGLLPLGWGVSAPLRKNFQPETESQLSGRVLCRQEWQRTRHFLGGQTGNSPLAPAHFSEGCKSALSDCSARGKKLGGDSGGVWKKPGSRPLRNIPSHVLGRTPQVFE